MLNNGRRGGRQRWENNVMGKENDVMGKENDVMGKENDVMGRC